MNSNREASYFVGLRQQRIRQEKSAGSRRFLELCGPGGLHGIWFEF
jgi:hypothetical protein